MVLDLSSLRRTTKKQWRLSATLAPKAPAVEGQIQGEILVLHGELDSMVTLDDVASFREEMHAAKVDHEVIILKMRSTVLATHWPMRRAKSQWRRLGL